MTGLLSADSPEVVDFMAAYEENRNLATTWRYRIVGETRRGYITIDEADADGGPSRSGRFMVARATGEVFTIRGYGKKGYRIGTLADLTGDYRAASATFRPDARCHTETSRSRVARW